MAFPTTFDTIKDTWSGSEAPYGHANHHNTIATLLNAIQNKIGINSSTDTNSMQYKIADLYSTKAGQKVSSSIDTFVDSTTATKKMRFDISLLTTSRVFKFPDRTDEFVLTATTDRTGDINHVLRGDGTFGLPASLSSVPSGAMMMWLTASAPTGYLLCDGTAVSRTTYAGLYAVIGTTYGAGDGSTTFNLPNMKGRVPVGYDSTQTEFNTMGKTGGAKTHTLITNEMPSHRHTVNTDQQGTGGYSWGSLAANTYGHATYFDSTNAGSQLLGNTGGDQPHNNLQPYIAINFIIKT